MAGIKKAKNEQTFKGEISLSQTFCIPENRLAFGFAIRKTLQSMAKRINGFF
jgi:hypothetical protein